jgi:hypothetical protein
MPSSATSLPIADLLDGDALLAVVEEHGEIDALREEAAQRFAYEQQIGALHAADEHWVMHGYCAPCRRAALLRCDWVSTWGGTPNFRERLHCPYCGLNSRQRFMTQLTEALGEPPYYLYETVTPFYRWAAATLPDVTGSEYLGWDIPGGTVIDGLRHEDALNLSFADASMGTIVSNDVFEHVADIDATLSECVRVLRPGGRLLLSIPFSYDKPETVVRAELRDGEPVHLLEPVYHGNPLDQAKGSLVFYDHGWDILERMRAAGFSQAAVVFYWSHLYGYLGRGMQYMLVATR